jgi:hypothetical protein
MADVSTGVTSESWISRIVGSIVGVLFGGLMVVGSLFLLFWNEGRAVRTAQSLATGGAEVVSIPSDHVLAENEGRLVHTTGDATTSETLADADFGVTVQAIHLTRKAEMYQWKETRQSETRKKLGGGTETVTTYTYSNAWSPTLIDSAAFHDAAGHQNPAAMPIAGAHWTARAVTVGDFTLAPAQIDQLDHADPVPAATGVTPPTGVTASAGGFYRGADANTPAVGDERITFEAVRPATISLVARQVGHSFEPDQRTAVPILLVTYGTVSADQMFKTAESHNETMTWVLRGAGFAVMLIGFLLVFRPLVTVADVVPVIGTILGAGTFVVAFFLAFCLALATIAVAWIVYRPILGVLLFAGAIASFVVLHRMAAAKGAAKAVDA